MSGLTAQIRTEDGWPVAGAVLTITSLEGKQLGRAAADESGALETDALPPGMHTAVVTAPGHKPLAQMARISSAGTGTLGEVRLESEAGAVATPPAGPWTIDPVHSHVTVTARHLGIASIRARFDDVSGRLDVAETFERTTGYAEIKSASIDTGVKMRDEHLRSGEFLDVERFPVIGFTSTGLRRTGVDTWVMPGELELHGQRKAVELTVNYGGYGGDPWGGVRAAFHAETLLRRDDFAIDYNAMVRAGVAAVGTNVKIDLDIELVQGDSLPQM